LPFGKEIPGTALIKLLNLKVLNFSHGHPTTIWLSSGGNVTSGGIISSAVAFMTGTPGGADASAKHYSNRP